MKLKWGHFREKRPRIFQINISVSLVGVGEGGSGKSGAGNCQLQPKPAWPSEHAQFLVLEPSGSLSLQFPLWVEEARRERRGREREARQNSEFSIRKISSQIPVLMLN